MKRKMPKDRRGQNLSRGSKVHWYLHCPRAGLSKADSRPLSVRELEQQPDSPTLPQIQALSGSNRINQESGRKIKRIELNKRKYLTIWIGPYNFIIVVDHVRKLWLNVLWSHTLTLLLKFSSFFSTSKFVLYLITCKWNLLEEWNKCCIKMYFNYYWKHY